MYLYSFFMQHDKQWRIQLIADVLFCGESMPDNYNVFDKLNGNIAKKKLEKALDMLRNESPQEIRKRLGQMDTDEILDKMGEYDAKKLNQMGISLDDLKGKITEKDLDKIIQILGPDGGAIAQRIKALLK